jgi:calcineurin-like phosphoesterase family protein
VISNTPGSAGNILGATYPADRVAFTSDLHLGHDKPFIVEARGFRSIKAHDAAIEKALMSLHCERLFLLGDIVASGASKTERVSSLVRRLPYPVTLVLGNHDPSAEALAALAPVENTTFIDLGGTLVELCHYPADFVDHRGRDFSDRLPPDDGGILLHGHSHSRVKLTLTAKGTRQIQVGWDAWGRPATGTEVLAVLGQSA